MIGSQLCLCNIKLIFNNKIVVINDERTKVVRTRDYSAGAQRISDEI